MKPLNSLFSIVLILVTTSTGALAIESPEQIRTTITNSPITLVDEVMKLYADADEISDYEMFNEYLNLLALIEEKAGDQGVDKIHPDLVSNLADKLVSHGMRWISLIEHSEEEITSLMIHMKEATLGVFLEQIDYKLKYVSVDYLLTNVPQNLLVIREFIERKYSNNHYLYDKSLLIASELAQNVLGQSVFLTISQYDTWLVHLLDDAAIVNEIYYQYGMLVSEGRDVLESMIQQNLSLGRHLNENIDVRHPVSRYYSDLLFETLRQALHYEIEISTESYRKSLEFLSPLDLDNYAEAFAALDVELSSASLENYIRLIEVTIQVLHGQGMLPQVTRLQGVAERQFAFSWLNLSDYEASYQLIDSQNRTWKMILFRSQAGSFSLSLSRVDGPKILFNEVRYSFEDQKFYTQTQRDDQRPDFLEFGLDRHLVDVNIPFSFDGVTQLSGQILKPLPETPQLARLFSGQLEGTYSGSLEVAQGEFWDVELSLFKVGGDLKGRIVNKNGSEDIILVGGFNKDEELFFLNSDIRNRYDIHQLRIFKAEGETTLRFYSVNRDGFGNPSSLQKTGGLQ